MPRVERGVGVLEHHDRAPPQRAQGRLRHGRDVGAVELHGAAGGFHQPQQGVAEGGLAAPGLPHQPQRLAAPDLQVDAVDRAAPHPPAGGAGPSSGGEVHLQTAGPHEHVAHSPTSWTSGPWNVAARCGTEPDPATRTSGGCSVAQRSSRAPGSAGGTRSPAGGRWARGGVPGIATRSGASPAVSCSVGQRRPAARACRGGRGASNTSSTPAVLDAAPAVHHQHPVGDAGDDPEVVGDPHDAGAVLGLQPPRRARGSAPAPSRRGRWWPRRR